MSKEMKYIVCHGVCPILFSAAQKHSEFKHFNPESAGFCRINNKDRYQVSCYGESVSLNLKSRSRDEILISNMLNEY